MRILFLLIFSAAFVLAALGPQQISPVPLNDDSMVSPGSLVFVMRDSTTGFGLSGEVLSKAENGVRTIWTNGKGQTNYQLLSGRNELQVASFDHKTLLTHFELDSQSVKHVTFWLDPLEPSEELRPEVVASRIRPGQALLHGHVFDSATGLPLEGAQVYLEHAGVKTQTNARGYFLLYARRPMLNASTDLPNSDNLIVIREGLKTYRRANVTIPEGATHFIIDMTPGDGLVVQDDTHKLKLNPDELANTQTEVAATDNQIASSQTVDSFEASAQQSGVPVPSSIRVGSNCPTRSSCTTFNVYTLDTYVKNGLDDEWISSWHAESLKAGAIAYRSYGVYHVYHPLSANYDICNTTSCQVNDPTDSSSRALSATTDTAGMLVVDSSGTQPFFAEYAAENNDNFCADGFTGSPSTNWSCMSDPVDAGQAFNGHGRGMCQWGTQRWAINEGKDYVWIVNHYYNNNGNPSGARSGFLQ